MLNQKIQKVCHYYSFEKVFIECTKTLHFSGSYYQMIKEHMTNTIQEIFYKLNEWLDSKFATYGNIHNTFTGGKYKPVTYDYIFHKANKTKTNAWTNWFDLTFFKTKIFESLEETLEETTTEASQSESKTEKEESHSKKKRSTVEKTISLSDHEGIQSTIYFWI